MKYLLVWGERESTGIRDKYEPVEIDPWDLNISEDLRIKIRDWQKKYEEQSYHNFSNHEKVKTLDHEGEEIALLLKKELVNVKIEYISEATLKVKLM